MCTYADVIEERGIDKGIEKGVKAIIEFFQEMGLSREDTVLKLEAKFELTKEEIEEKMLKYWK